MLWLGAVEATEQMENPSWLLPSLRRSEGLSDSTVAICMATHDPEISLFIRQIESLMAQSHEDWICIISDDCSPPEKYFHLREIVSQDNRFYTSRSSRRLGVYRNFERVLSLVPAQCGFVSLSDQDDRWHAHKLETLLSRLNDESTSLVFSDMNVVDRDGGIISPSFWTHRRNNYEDLASLVLANTVTGAASLFRRDLLDLALPFPMQVGGSLHDHWIACVALTLGRIKYIDEPLHDYVQHGENVLGHFAPHRNGKRSEVLRFLRAVPGARSGRLARTARWEAIYFNDLIRLKLIAKTLELRCGMVNGDKSRALRRLARLDESASGAAWLVARSLRRRYRLTTLGAEDRLAGALLWRRLLQASVPDARGMDFRDASHLPASDAEPGASETAAWRRDARIEHLQAQKEVLEADITSLQEGLSAKRAELAANETAVSELRNEIAAIRESESRRRLSRIRGVVTRLRRARLYIGCPVEARPGAGLNAIATDGRVTNWTLTDEDPQFDLIWSRPHRLPPGRYRLTLEMPDGGEDLVLPRLYVDSGTGMSEEDRIDLHFEMAGDGKIAAQLELPSGAVGLRFDPSVTPGKLFLGRIRIRKVGRLERNGGLASGAHGVAANLPAAEIARPAEYRSWIEQHDWLTEAKLAALRRRLEGLDDPLLISVVMPVYNTPEDLLREAIESVRAQVYDRWELCIADDCSTERHVRRILEEYSRDDPRIKVVYRD
ncbi:MAG: glycosyltransferase, partial [Gemmatimonadota bacterium]